MAEGADTQANALANAGGGTSVDMASEKDRGMVRRIIQQYPRWKVPETDKDEYLLGLKEANRVARAHLTDPDHSLDAARTVASIVKTAAMIEGQNQKDEHEARQDERERAALNKPDGPTIIVISSPPRARLD